MPTACQRDRSLGGWVLAYAVFWGHFWISWTELSLLASQLTGWSLGRQVLAYAVSEGIFKLNRTLAECHQKQLMHKSIDNFSENSRYESSLAAVGDTKRIEFLGSMGALKALLKQGDGYDRCLPAKVGLLIAPFSKLVRRLLRVTSRLKYPKGWRNNHLGST